MALNRCECAGHEATPEVDELVARTMPRGDSRSDTGLEPAVADELWELHVLYERTRCPDLLDRLVTEYQPYAAAQARRWLRHGETFEDLNQVALEALVVALQRFECERSIPFVGYARTTIIGSIKRHFRDHGWALRVPRVVHQLATPVRESTDHLGASLGRPPTTSEVATDLGVEVSTVRKVQTAAQARTVLSLTSPEGEDSAPQLGAYDHGFQAVDSRIALVEAMEQLDERSRTVIGMYFFMELTQVQIAQKMGVSQMQVSRWINSSLRRMRAWTIVEPEAALGHAAC